MEIPTLLPARIVSIPLRGEMFVRHHQHSDASAPTLLLLHGWTASCDTQFFAAYEALSQDFSIVGVDHRGHGRGLRPNTPVSLEDCADDAAAVGADPGDDVSGSGSQRAADAPVSSGWKRITKPARKPSAVAA